MSNDLDYNKKYYADNRERERARSLVWYNANKDRRRANGKEWRAKNPDRVRANNERWQKANPEAYARIVYRRVLNARCKKFGITTDQYYKMLADQAGKCAICKRDETDNGKDLAIDHDHSTGRVRGLLCHHCNAALGHVSDNVDHLQRMIAYLKE
jgi:hypothetical protein